MDVAVGGGEVVGQGALVGDFDAVADHVIAACIQTGEQAVPVALDIFRLHAQLLSDGAGDLDIVADEGVALVVMSLPLTWMAESWSAASADSLLELELLFELDALEEQPDRVSTPAAARTLIREIKVLLFMVSYPFESKKIK